MSVRAEAPLVGGYRLEAVIGEGSFATVHRGRHAESGEVRAVKVLNPGIARQWELRARFWREAELVAGLRHPNVVRVHGHGIDGVPYMVMELIAGRTLADELAAGRHWERPLDRWIAQTASALDHAHDRGIVHRDLKPANVLIDPDDDRACLADFGIARLVTASGLTGTGLAIGSCAYMSPEQCRGAVRELDRRADVYGLAALLFELATGRPPFGRGEAAVGGHLTRPPPPASRLNAGLPPSVDTVLARGLAKSPDDRHRSAGELAAAFLCAFAGRRPVRFGPALTIGAAPVPLGPGLVLIGRRAGAWAPGVDLSGADPDHRVSRRHAELRREDGRCWVRDLGSRNGTEVNGARLEPAVAHPLRDGDRLGFGGVEGVYLAALAWPPGAADR